MNQVPRVARSPLRRDLRRSMAAAALMAALASGCASGVPAESGGGFVAGATTGSPLGAYLSRVDLRTLEASFGETLDAGRTGVRAEWRGAEAQGEITPGAFVLGGIDLGDRPRPELPPGLALDAPIETDLGLHALTRNANVRIGPSTEHRILETMDAGDAVDVLGRVAGRQWMLAATSGRVRGYIHESLLIRQPGAELELAGGPTRQPVLCRRFEQRLEVAGRADRWSGVACREGAGWRVETPPPGGPTRLY